jgi:hypothetical protein
MAITSGHVIAGTIPVQIDGSAVNQFRLHIHNQDNQENLYIGGPDVTVNNGLRLLKEDSTELVVSAGDGVFVVSNSENHLVSYLKLT